MKDKEVRKAMQDLGHQTQLTYTEVASLFPPSQQGAGEENCAASSMAISEVFGLEDTMHRLVGGDVNSLGNVLTLAKSLRNLLDDCVFWLEEIDAEPNTYETISHFEFLDRCSPAPRPRIAFAVDPTLLPTQEERDKLPLPDRGLMAIRAACARVAYMSGAAEHRERILREEEIVDTLAEGGSYASLLSSLSDHRAPTSAVATYSPIFSSRNIADAMKSGVSSMPPPFA
ncbi:hypothetical protein BDV98DRAFT_575672 [Pterulicium gracile]|uniref:HNH nuclease domain-containing protein n=1 Tax=Pterulicium gracile TaxID=1884261 RepID=A0A5C3Q3Y5_9AGAR|nr:hypothetical protein BDV98DRAFT_575672 [Pterula gracilis]